MEFSQMVKKRRNELNLTQGKFAKELGVSWMTIWRWENGQGQPKEDAIGYWIDKLDGRL